MRKKTNLHLCITIGIIKPQKVAMTLFFDLDDTILAGTATGSPVWKTACEKSIHNFESVSVAELHEAIENFSRWYWADEERHRNGRLNHVKARREVVIGAFEALQKRHKSLPSKKIAYEIADYFTANRNDKIVPFPHAIETLQKVKANGIPTALITNGEKKYQQYKIDRFDLAQYFDIILIEGALGYGKPDPRVFQRALDHVGAKPQNTTMIGDSLYADIAGAQKLGIATVWNDWEKKGLPQDAPAKPDRTINAISELLSQLK